MRHFLLPIFICFFLFVLSSCQHPVDKPTTAVVEQEPKTNNKQQHPKLYGAWKSEGPREFKGYFYNYEYRFTLNRWELITTISADSLFKNIVLVLREEGLFDSKSVSVENFAMEFKTLRKYAKAVKRDPKIISILGMSRCLNKFKVEVDVTKQSCGLTSSNEECDLQYEFLILKNQKFELGERQLLERKCKPTERASEPRIGFKKII